MLHRLPRKLQNTIRKGYYLLPTKLRFLVRRLAFYPIDFIDYMLGRRHKYEPPKGKIFTGAGDFIKTGKFHLHLLQKHAGLTPDDVVLDIGSGMGRTAVALTEFLNNEAIYEGFDVTKKGVDWCTEKIHKDFPNFNFKYVELANDLYNHSKQNASNYVFPFEPDTFDVAFLFSVFTHMQPDEVDNYLKEINRTLKPNGRCLATFFTYNDLIKQQLSNNQLSKNFPFDMGDYRLMDKKVTSANVAYSEVFLKNMILNNNFEIDKVIDGFWKTERIDDQEYQDIYILRKLI